MKSLKNFKSAGIDDIKAEHIKHAKICSTFKYLAKILIIYYVGLVNIKLIFSKIVVLNTVYTRV